MYYTVKTIFLLYLALPQTRGSSYLYANHLQPFFHNHETQIDAALASFKARLYAFFQEKARMVYQQVALGMIPGMQPAASAAPPQPEATGPAALASTLWASFAPSIGAAILGRSPSQAVPAAPHRRAATLATPGSSTFRNSAAITPELTAEERRKQLQAELDMLEKETDRVMTDSPGSGYAPLPAASGSVNFRKGGDNTIRGRPSTAQKNGFEDLAEEEMDGYDIGEEQHRMRRSMTVPQKRTSSWWGGWGSSAQPANAQPADARKNL